MSAARAIGMDLAARVKDYHERARPPWESTTDEKTFVLVPDSEPGKEFAGVIKRALPAALTIRVQGAATDLMFCREQGCLRPSEVLAIVSACQPAYYQSLATPHTNPHARFDVTEWMPLNE
jgi:hypothetical protein